MKITDIPFHKLLKIEKSRDSEDVLKLAFTENMQNHIGTFHASAQFALAEVTSGLALQQEFSQLENSVIPILHKADAKFKKPAESNITAHASIETPQKETFLKRFESKGRGTISVSVEIKDQNDIVTMSATFKWYLQKV
ncbi:MAG: DUF4442 domain-containing protein [Desulfotalea sp.]